MHTQPAMSDLAKEKTLESEAVVSVGPPISSDAASDNSGLDALDEKNFDQHDRVIVTGSDASNHLISVRDDGDPAVTFRSMLLGTLVAAFQASMNQIYMVGFSGLDTADIPV